MLISRVIVIILDGVGVGALPDAFRYGDEGANTLAHVAEAVGGLNLPCLERLGLGRVIPLAGVRPEPTPQAAYGKMMEVSPGKDTTTGHWELMGIKLARPFPTYPRGFPKEIIEKFEQAIGRRIIGNRPASGTKIIEELGEEHLRTGSPIVYTSADSVFQIACHEEIIPVEELYSMCRTAREILTGEHAVSRVIARPFIGKPGAFRRTERRHDFSLPPPEDSLLDALALAGIEVTAVGKVADIFAGRGISKVRPAGNNAACTDEISRARTEDAGLIVANLVDFDTLYGHRNDAPGFARALEEFDCWLSELVPVLTGDEVLIITADHGCDPTTPGTDHTREFVPLLVYSPEFGRSVDLGIRTSFADVGQTIADLFGLKGFHRGRSMLDELVDVMSGGGARRIDWRG